jgi:hypothetical protein
MAIVVRPPSLKSFSNQKNLSNDRVVMLKNSKVGSFLMAPKDLEGFRSQKNLIFQNSQIKL